MAELCATTTRLKIVGQDRNQPRLGLSILSVAVRQGPSTADHTPSAHDLNQVGSSDTTDDR